MRVKMKKGGKAVTLNSGDFLARGGGGEIYVQGNTVYKVCHNGQMPQPQKLQELAVLDRPNIIRPLDEFVADDGRDGYTMTYVNNPVPLTQLVTVTYRNRNKITPDTMLKLVRKHQEGIQFVHSKGVLIVDLNELNFLTDSQYQEVYFIDVDAYQTRSFPAQVIMDTIRDRQVTKRDAKGNLIWTELSDWYSFAIVSFMMFVGMHPYKGRHPQHSDMDSLMRHNLSILNPAVKFPKPACLPFDVIPDTYKAWYKAVLEEGKRVPPPADLVQVITLVTPTVKTVSGSNTFVTRPVHTYPNDILEYLYTPSCEVVVTVEYEAFVNRQPVASPAHPYVVGFVPNNGPVAAYVEAGKVHLQDLTTGAVSVVANGEEVMATQGRVYVKNRTQMFEVQFANVGGRLMATPQKICDVADKATQVFEGVVVQSLFDAYNITVFPDAKQCRQFQVRELDGYRIVDAKYEKRVLMLVAVDAKTGRYDRFIFRFGRDWAGYDVRVISDIPNMGVNFTVLNNHKVVTITEDGKLEICFSDRGNAAVKAIEDPVIEPDMLLASRDDEVLFSKGRTLYTITARTP